MIAVIIIKAMYSSKECIAFLFVYEYKIAIEKVSTNKHKAKARTNIPLNKVQTHIKFLYSQIGTVYPFFTLNISS